MKRTLLSASAASASIPGLAAILKGIGAPPHAGVWLGGFGTAAGAFTMIMFMTNSGRVKKLPLSRVNRYSVALVLVGVLMLGLYIWVYSFCVQTHPAYGTVVYPLWSTGDLAKMIEHAGGRWGALDLYGSYAIYTAVAKSSDLVWVLTTLAFLLPYVMFVAGLTGGFALAVARRSRAAG